MRRPQRSPTILLCGLLGCAGGAGDSPSELRVRTDEPAAAPSDLQWKRYAAFESDLARALALPREELCRELGSEPCIRKVHLVPLGGNEPLFTGMYEPSAEPLATTPTVVDRVVLTACSNRVARDRAVGADALVFAAFPLDGAAPRPDDASARALVAALFRRLLARDPTDSELEVIAALAADRDGQPVSAAEFAKLACFAIGTSAEFLFF